MDRYKLGMAKAVRGVRGFGEQVDDMDVFFCANMCQGGIFGLVMNLWTRLGVFLVKTVCVGDSSMVGVSSFLEAEETMQHVRGVVLAATIMAALQVTVIAWYEIVVSFVFYIRMHALSCLVVESDCVSDN